MALGVERRLNTIYRKVNAYPRIGQINKFKEGKERTAGNISHGDRYTNTSLIYTDNVTFGKHKQNK